MRAGEEERTTAGRRVVGEEGGGVWSGFVDVGRGSLYDRTAEDLELGGVVGVASFFVLVSRG